MAAFLPGEVALSGKPGGLNRWSFSPVVWKKNESLVSSEPVGGNLSSTQKVDVFSWGGDEFFFLERFI